MGLTTAGGGTNPILICDNNYNDIHSRKLRVQGCYDFGGRFKWYCSTQTLYEQCGGTGCRYIIDRGNYNPNPASFYI